MSQFKQSGYFDPSTLSGLMVSVRREGGPEYQGALIHFTGGTLKVQFWGDDLPAFGLTEPLSISINGLSVELPVLPACAMERNELPGGRAYRFAYTLTPEFQEKIPEDLRVLFPSRASHRVRPTADAPVVASLEDLNGGTSYPAKILDLSSSGVGLTVDRETEFHLHSQRTLRLRFHFPSLPEEERDTALFGRVVHRGMLGSEIRYGISFDLELELEATGHDALIRYIVSQESREA